MKPRPKSKQYTIPTITGPWAYQILGLDISLSNTGIASIDPDTCVPVCNTFQTKSTEPHIPRCKRIANKLSGSRAAITLTPESVVFVREDYAYGAQGIADVHLKELGGIVKAAFYDEGHDLHAMPIGSWKKFITGKGNADKALVQKALTKILQPEMIKGWTEHDFDAAGIALTAKFVVYRDRLQGLTSYQEEVIQNLVEKASSLVLLDV